MTREDIIAWAREADLIDDTYASDWYVYQLERFAALVAEAATEEANRRANTSWSLMCKKMVAAEREACAKACEDWTRTPATNGMELTLVAAAIRARGETK